MSARILVVEDEAVIAHSLSFILDKLGYQTCAMVDSGEKAIEAVQSLLPDLILMDVSLSTEMDGISAATILQAEPHCPPLIFLTAYADESTIHRAKSISPFGYILKPFDERELSICIEIALYKSQSERKLKETEQRFLTVLKSIGEAVVLTDVSGHIDFVNFLAEDLLGLSAHKDKGLPLGALIRFPAGQDTWQQAMIQGITITLPGGTQVSTPKAEHLVLGPTTISPIIDDYGNTLGSVIVIRRDN